MSEASGVALEPARSLPADAVGRARRDGLTLHLTGLLGMLLGVSAFLWAQSRDPFDMARYRWREVAGVALGVALPLFVLGVQRSLPARRWAAWAAYAGLAACLASVAAFSWLYPYSWNVAGRDASPYTVIPYSGGVVLLAAAAFMGLVDAYLDRHARAAGGGAASEAPVTEDEVLRDIEEQTRRQRLSWGGVMLSDGPTIALAPSALDSLTASDSIGRRFVLDDQPTGPEVDRLLAFRGTKRAAQEDMEPQAAALLALRSERERREAERRRTPWGRLRAWLSGR